MTETQIEKVIAGAEMAPADGDTRPAEAASAAPAQVTHTELEPHLSHTAARLASPLVRMVFGFERLKAKMEFHPTTEEERLFVALEEVRALRADQLRSHQALGNADQVDAVLFRRSIDTSNRRLEAIIAAHQVEDRNTLIEAEWTNAHRQAMTRMAERHERLVTHIESQLKLEGLVPATHSTFQHGVPEPRSPSAIGLSLHLKYGLDSYRLKRCSEFVILYSATADDGQLILRLMQPDCPLRPAKRINADNSWRTASAIVQLEVMRALETKSYELCMEQTDRDSTPVFPYRCLNFELRPVELERPDVMQSLATPPSDTVIMRKVQRERWFDLGRRVADGAKKQLSRFIAS
ncbi:MAG: hypothetical protein K1X83_14485 [Oligoflexia bacterium]|nr:hypothetical protein [Oligoflexia bacterium]